MAGIRTLKIADIQVDFSINQRVEKVSEQVVEEYVEALRRGDVFPPVTVFCAGQKVYYLADGFHRLAAHDAFGLEKIPCQVISGNRSRAIEYACGCNAEHGYRRTNADKRRAVESLLHLHKNYSDRKIAELARVSDTLVQNVRQLLLQSTSLPVGHIANEPLEDCEPEQIAVLAEVERTLLKRNHRHLITTEPAEVVATLVDASSDFRDLTEAEVETVQQGLIANRRESKNGKVFYSPALSAPRSNGQEGQQVSVTAGVTHKTQPIGPTPMAVVAEKTPDLDWALHNLHEIGERLRALEDGFETARYWAFLSWEETGNARWEDVVDTVRGLSRTFSALRREVNRHERS
jgi:hypothetical protein